MSGLEGQGLHRFRPLLPVLFAVTGTAGLVYEVVWFKLLDSIFGVTALATSTVLAVFMGGLGLGAAIAARRADGWERPLFVYGVLEAALGVFAGAVPFLLPLVNRTFLGLYDTLQPSLAVLSILRAALCAVILLPPATLMGMTLPVIARAFSRDETAAPDVGLLYTINTLGAAAGAAVAGFVLLPALGLRATSGVAVVLNLAVGGAAILLGRGARLPAAAAADRAARQDPIPPLLLTISALSGLTSLGYQVFWTRALVLSFGNTVYAFSVILVAVLVGITIGSGVATGLLRRARRPARVLAVTQLLAAIAVASLFWIFDDLPVRFAELSARWAGSFAGYLGATFLLAFATLLPAAVLLGMGLPLALGVAIAGARGLARDVGSLYSVNTWGAIVGSLAAGFLALPALGVRGGALVFAALNALAAVLATFLATRRARPRLLAAAGIGVAVAVLATLSPAWDPNRMTRGTFERPGDAGARDEGDLVYYRDGVISTVNVRRRGSDFRLKVDGRTEATAADYKTNTVLGSLPMTLHPHPEKALVVGLGSGVTLAAVLQHPVREVECIELSPEVVEAARLFDKWLDGALDDPRVVIRASDGRNHLALTRMTYDVIVSQPSNLWAAGVGSLFTREFFELARDRLAGDGILCQWLQGYSVSKESLVSVLHTIASVFPSVDVWVAEWSDIVVIASKSRAPVEAVRLEAVFADPRTGGGWRRAGVSDIPTLLSHFMLDDDAVRRFSRDAPMHTDDDRRVELEEPRSLARGTVSQQARTLLAWQCDVRKRLSGWPPAGGPADVAEAALAGAIAARRMEIEARYLAAAGRGTAATEEYRRALASNPEDLAVRRNLAALHVRMGVEIGRRGDLTSARANFLEAIRVDPESHDSWANLGLAELLAGNTAAALEATRRAEALDPANERYVLQEAAIHRHSRRWEESIDAYRRAEQLWPLDAGALVGLAESLARAGRTDDARRTLEEARAAGADAPATAGVEHLLGVGDAAGRS